MAHATVVVGSIIHCYGNVILYFKGGRIVLEKPSKCLVSSHSDGSFSSRISTKHMDMVVQKVISKQTRDSTAKTYLSIWRQFNKFILQLDVLPHTWEHRTTLYMAYLVEKGSQSSTIKSYVSAIKKLLMMDRYKWKDSDVLLHSLTKACRLISNRVSTRLPIHCSLLEMILFEVERIYHRAGQPYLVHPYKAIFVISYYGMMRIGEVTDSPCVLKAKKCTYCIK